MTGVSAVVRFLHVADVHLGFDRYDNPERTRDFFESFYDVLWRYGVQAQVDCVVIAGDLFEHQTIMPNILNQAQLALELLKEAGIPVVAIEGNHDNRPYGVKTSWLRYLCEQGYLYLLEPESSEAGLSLPLWTEGRGGYLDLPCGVRLLGSRWYGASAPAAIRQLAIAIEALPPTTDPVVMLFHHGLEGQIARYAGALRYTDLLPLREAGVDYLALGHIHKAYCVEGWVFNPGSICANSMAEVEIERGAYLVEIAADKTIRAELVQDYQQRAAVRLAYKAKAAEPVEAVQAGVLAQVRAQALDPAERVLLELKITGELGFARYELDVKALQQQIQSLTGALVVLLKLEADSVDYSRALTATEQVQRSQLELEVFRDLLASHAHYRRRSEPLSHLVLDVKGRLAEQVTEAELYALIEAELLAGD